MPKRNLTGGGKSLSDLRGRAAHGVDFFGFFKKIICFLKKKSLGTAILETALTLPVVLYIIFFSIELIRMQLAQVALDAITKECTFSLMAKGNTSDFDSIFQKYKPFGIPIGNFRYYIRLYQNIHTNDNKGVMDVSPYGGETICWAGNDWANPSDITPTTKASGASYGTGAFSNPAIFNKYQTVLGIGSDTYGEVGGTNRKQLLDSKVPSGYIFVLTVAVNFPFSSPFVKKLFSGGTNTNRTGVYILWARGSGMIN